MKRLKFHYHMEIQFDIPVHDHHFTLKCLPRRDAGQQVEKIRYEVYPNYFISIGMDSFQNETIYGFCQEEHDHFTVDVQGTVKTGLSDRITADSCGGDLIYKYQTPHTMPGGQIMAYHRKLEASFLRVFVQEEQKNTLARTMYYMQWLHEDFGYESGATLISTTAEEAFTTGRGVCQDYAHIFLSLLRMAQIPCRYITGMMIGEGFSHAWVEVLTEEGWIAVDPTNGHLVGADYICIAKGRDYKDCLLNQGVFTGCGGKAAQTQTIHAEVREIGEQDNRTD